MRLHRDFVVALVKRDLWKYCTNPTGYVFVTLFILLSAAGAFWQDRFFQANLANLEALNSVFPYLLAFFVPALTMGVWSEEKKQATDELLLTLPATSLDVVVGKYAATLTVYSVALALSLSHVLVLAWLGAPDLGLMLANYAGYWLLGAAMIAVGMLASMLTANATIAFVCGAAFCSALAFGPRAVSFSETLSRQALALGVGPYFEDFAGGVLSLSGVIYFVTLAGLALYLNVLLVDRRHWPARLDGWPTWVHHAARMTALVVAAIAVNAILGRAGVRLDVTAEGLHSLSDETRGLIAAIPEDRPVFIQAFVSPEVPEQYVAAREDLLDVLEDIDAIGGGRVEVRIQDTEPYSEQAREARETFGITSREVPNLSSARTSLADVFMGLAFTSGPQEQVIPFLDRGLSAEYEVTRSIRVVADSERKRVGIISTGLNVLGGMDFQAMRSSPEWSVVGELRKQYEVESVDPDLSIDPDLDALLVLQPSTLSEAQMDTVGAAIEAGMPALLLVDPLPIVDVSQAPSAQGGDGGLAALLGGASPPPSDNGDIGAFLRRLGVQWNSAEIAWDAYNPHPDLAQLAEEIVFVGAGNGNDAAFNRADPASGALEELVFLYPGHIAPAAGSDLDFEPLVRSGFVSGALPYFQLVQQTLFGLQLNPSPPHVPDNDDFVVAAHVRGSRAAASGTSDAGSGAGESDPEEAAGDIDVVVIADVDFISEQFFQIRAEAPGDLDFDNVTFFLNTMDQLVGDTDFIALRSKRPRHRTLERVEERTRGFLEARIEGEKQAEADADAALEEAQQRLDERVEAVRQRTDLDAQTKQIMARNLQEAENRRFEVLQANIEQEKEARISASQEEMETRIRQIQNSIRTFAVLLPPLPVFGAGIGIFLRRRRKEREGEGAARRLRSAT